jgi:hypothetical protein
VSPLELVGDFDRIAEELRASRPVASATLRERVAALEPVEPAGPRWSNRWPSRRLVLGVAAAALLASFVAAGLTRETSKQRSGVAHGSPGIAGNAARARGFTPQGRVEKAAGDRLTFGAATVPAPSAARLERYQSTLRLRVKDVEALSGATRRAITLARSLGGFVGSVEYSTRGGKRGSSRVVLRVPVGEVQSALVTLTGLGTILQQQTGILDVTRRADRESRQLAKLQRQLETASAEEAPALRARLKTLQTKHRKLLRSASLARIVLVLTTPAKQAAAAPGRLHRTLDDAGGVLLRELQLLLYALVVAGPLLLLGGAGVATARAARRRSDRRLLERT